MLPRAAALARKDLRLEWRGREATTAMVTFAVLILLLLGFTLGSDAGSAPAIVWISLGLAAMIGVSRVTRAELEQDALETLLLYPGDREALFWGKWAALFVMLAGLLAFLLMFMGILFNLDLWTRLPHLLGAGMLGIIGLASLGTLMAGLTLNVRGQELLLPLLLIPVALPVVLAGVRVTEGILGGTGIGPWLILIVMFDLIFLLAAPVLYEHVLEE